MTLQKLEGFLRAALNEFKKEIKIVISIKLLKAEGSLVLTSWSFDLWLIHVRSYFTGDCMYTTFPYFYKVKNNLCSSIFETVINHKGGEGVGGSFVYFRHSDHYIDTLRKLYIVINIYLSFILQNNLKRSLLEATNRPLYLVIMTFLEYS